MQACHDFMSPVPAPSDVTQPVPVCTHVESMLKSLRTLQGELRTMQSDEATVLRERRGAPYLLHCAERNCYGDVRSVCMAARTRNGYPSIAMLPGARQPARVGMEHTALKLTDPSLLRMVAAGRQGELVGSVTPQRATRPIETRIVLLRVATRSIGEPFCPQAR